MGSSSSDQGYGVTVDSSDNIYVTGYTYGGLDGNTSSGSNDIFLLKYNSSGSKQ
ncbi:MAG: SBBP repeat-containing protein [SAR324 cluster bacterium]|nr:SBBP repeat-containing protein [SAR324 cluster bacterium]